MNPFADLLRPIVDRPGLPGPGRRHKPTGRVHLMHDEARTADGLSPAEEFIAREQRRARVSQVYAERNGITPAERRALTVEENARNGIVYLPLEPGQTRRRRAGPDGKPLKRAGRGKGGYVLPPAPVVYKGPARAPGEMTYGAAVRLIHRSKDGDLVDLEDLCRAHDVVRQAREAGATA